MFVDCAAVYVLESFILFPPCPSSFKNIWARYGAVGFITAAAQQMDEVDTLCYIVPEVKPFLRQPIVNLDDQVQIYMS